MRSIRWLAPALVITLGLGGLGQAPPWVGSGQAADPARDDAIQRRQYEQAAEQALAELEGEMRQLEQRLEALRAEARARFERGLAELRRKRRIVRRRLARLRAHAGAAWNDFRSGLDAALEELRRALEDTASDPEVIET
jgi:chromosome segregation ATPase